VYTLHRLPVQFFVYTAVSTEMNAPLSIGIRIIESGVVHVSAAVKPIGFWDYSFNDRVMGERYSSSLTK
jgi:hypothetical protein